MNDIIGWLESPEGEEWSRDNHRSIPVILVAMKDDADDLYTGWGNTLVLVA